MAKSYSIYEAKAKLSEIIRLVREHGRSAVITYRGEPVAQISALDPADGDRTATRLNELAATGALVRSPNKARLPGPIARRPGALDRFMQERGE